MINKYITNEIFENNTNQPTENKYFQSKDDIWNEIFTIIYYLEPLIYHGKKVVMINQIAEVFGISREKLLYRFRKYKSKEYFKYGEDYYMFDLDWEELEASNETSYINFKTYFLTEHGVQLFTKFLDNDDCIGKYHKIHSKNYNIKYSDICQYLIKQYFKLDKVTNVYKTFVDSKNQQQSLKTPIEIALSIDEDGMIMARKLYEFLEMDASNYYKWVKVNIIENPFAEENVDYFCLSPMASEQKKGNFTQDFKLTATFAKKLCMQGKKEHAEQARDYLVKKIEALKANKYINNKAMTNIRGNADESIKINDTELAVKVYQNQRVVTFKDIDAVHQRPEGTAKRNFSINKKHFTESEDYFKINRENVGTEFVLTYGFNEKAPSGMLFTESGYLMLVKSFTDDLAWEVQKKLVNTYFKAKNINILIKKFTDKATYNCNHSKGCTSSTPIPKIKDGFCAGTLSKPNDWFYNNYDKIEKILDSFGWERRYLYHIILKTIGQEYDLQAAKYIYKEELGISVKYAMDMVEYFDELSKAATKILDHMIKYLSLKKKDEFQN